MKTMRRRATPYAATSDSAAATYQPPTMLHALRLPSFSLAVLLLLGAAAMANAQTSPPFVSLGTARTAVEQSSQIVIDIREPYEHATGVAKGALLIPMSQLGKRLAELPAPGQQPFLVICNTQNRSSRVVEQLRTMGYTNASYVKGGMSLWATSGWPMVKP